MRKGGERFNWSRCRQSWLGKRLVNRETGLIAAVLMAFSGTQIYYAQEVRCYATAVLFAVAGTYAFVRALEGGGRKWWATHVALHVCLAFTHVFGLLLFCAQGAYLAARPVRGDWRRLGPWMAVHAVAYHGVMLCASRPWRCNSSMISR